MDDTPRRGFKQPPHYFAILDYNTFFFFPSSYSYPSSRFARRGNLGFFKNLKKTRD